MTIRKSLPTVVNITSKRFAQNLAGVAPETPVQTSAPKRAERYEPAFLVRCIVPSATNPRKTINEVKLANLVASVMEKGILQPLVGRPTANGDVIELVAGHRRLRAAEICGLSVVPVRILDLTDAEALEVQLIENLQREDVDPIEEAEGFAALMTTCQYTAEQLAEKIGVSPAAIYGALKLLKLPTAAKEAVVEGLLPTSTAQLIGRIPNDKLRGEASKAIIQGCGRDQPMSFKEAKDYIERTMCRELKGAPFDQADPSLTSAGACAKCPKKTGNDRVTWPEGRADICTDTACFDAKLFANGTRMLAAAKAAGNKVLEGKAAKGLFNEHQREPTLAYNSSYVDLAATNYECGNKSWRSVLLPEAAKSVTIAVDPKGFVHELVPKSVASAILRKSKPSNGRTEAQSKEQKTYTAKLAAEQAKRKRDIRVGEALAVQAEEVVQFDLANFIDGPMDVTRAMTKAIVQQFWGEAVEGLAKLREVEGLEGLDELIAKATPAGCYAILCQAIILCRYRQRFTTADQVKFADELIAKMKLDVKAAEKEAKTEPKKKARAS